MTLASRFSADDTQVVAAAYLIGLLFLRKQFYQERLGWHLPLPPRQGERPVRGRSGGTPGVARDWHGRRFPVGGEGLGDGLLQLF